MQPVQGAQAPASQTLPVPQDAQMLPPLPHWAWLSLPVATQVLPWQQPAQVPGPHVPPSAGAPQACVLVEQTWVPVQVTQAVPPVPQAPAEVPATQPASPSQQPLGQLVESQLVATHVPLGLQAWPAVQDLHAAPLIPQVASEVAPNPGFWHLPLESQQPVQFEALQPPVLPVTHWPLTQDCPFEQATQEEPLLPQELVTFPD